MDLTPNRSDPYIIIKTPKRVVFHISAFDFNLKKYHNYHNRETLKSIVCIVAAAACRITTINKNYENDNSRVCVTLCT